MPLLRNALNKLVKIKKRNVMGPHSSQLHITEIYNWKMVDDLYIVYGI